MTLFGPLSDQKFSWNERCESGFSELCNTLSSHPVILAFPKWDQPIIVEVDASKQAIGGVLTQLDRLGVRRPLAYFSSAFNITQANYSAGELEAWAIVAAARKGRKQLQAAPKVYFWSDHNSLQWMRKQPDPRGKFSRWILELEAINYEVIFRKGSENAAADFLSRSKGDTEHAMNDEEFLERHIYIMTETESKPGMSFEWVRMTQRKDTEVADALSQLATGDEVVKGKFANVKGLHVNNGGLWKGSRLVVPKEICNDIISIVHGNTHAGIQRTYHEIRKRFWWKGMGLQAGNYL